MRLITVLTLFHLMSCFCGEDSTMPEKYPAIEQMLDALPPHDSDRIRSRVKMWTPYFHLINIRDTISVYAAGAVFERKHPEQAWNAIDEEKPKYKENDAYFWLVAHVLYWYCNVYKQVPVDEQIKYFRKQDRVLQEYWVDVVLYLKLDASKQFALPLLRADMDSFGVCSSFRTRRDWWGEPSKFIDPKDSASWGEQARLALITFAALSEDTEFKLKVANELMNDPSRINQRVLESEIKSGRIPKPTSDQKGSKK